MTIKNTAEGYGAIAKWLHWATAILFLASFFSIYYRHWFTEVKSFESMIAFQLHLSVGVTIAVIVVLRIVWRITNQIPDPEPGTFLERTAAQLEHYALYAVMIILPVTGYLGTAVNTNYFFMFEITAVSLTIRNYLNRRMWQAWIRVTLIRDMNRTHPSPTRRKAILGGSTPASMRVMVVDKCVRFTSLVVNGTAVV